MIELRPEVEALIRERVESGAYASAEEVVERALELLTAEESWFAEQHDEIEAKIREGWDAARRGELMDVEQARRNLHKRKLEWIEKQRRA